MKPTLLFISALGLFLFGSVFLFSYNVPKVVETSAQDFLKSKVEEEVLDILKHEKLQSSVKFTKAISKRFGIESNPDSIRKMVEEDVPDLVTSVLAYQQSLDQKKGFRSKLALSTTSYLSKVKIGDKKLKTIIQEKYQSTSQNLRNDIRIFSGCNFILFLFLLILSFTKHKTLKALFIPAMLLLLATILSTLIYIFGQDWIYVLLYDNYMGFGYLIYVALIFFFLCDIAFFKATVTLFVLDIIGKILDAFSAFLSF
jgi:cation transport ATPase